MESCQNNGALSISLRRQWWTSTVSSVSKSTKRWRVRLVLFSRGKRCSEADSINSSLENIGVRPGSWGDCHTPHRRFFRRADHPSSPYRQSHLRESQDRSHKYFG